MFSGSELECLVCGPRDFTIASLKRNIRSIVDPQLLEWLYQVIFNFFSEVGILKMFFVLLDS
jgi:hypothetical protein